MKKMTFLLFASFYAFGAMATVISQQDEKSLEKDLSKSLSKSISTSTNDSFEALSQDALIFESADTKGDIEVEINGVAVYRRPGRTKYKNIVLRTIPYTVNNLTVLKSTKVEDALIIESTKEDLLNFRTTRSIKTSDANLVDCKGCPQIWSGYSLKSVVASGNSGDSLPGNERFRNGPRDAGSGMASGKRGHQKNAQVDTPDSELMRKWMGSSSDSTAKSLVLEYPNPDKETLELLKSARLGRVKVKFPSLTITTELESLKKITITQDSVRLEFAIKENGIK